MALEKTCDDIIKMLTAIRNKDDFIRALTRANIGDKLAEVGVTLIGPDHDDNDDEYYDCHFNLNGRSKTVVLKFAQAIINLFYDVGITNKSALADGYAKAVYMAAKNSYGQGNRAVIKRALWIGNPQWKLDGGGKSIRKQKKSRAVKKRSKRRTMRSKRI